MHAQNMCSLSAIIYTRVGITRIVGPSSPGAHWLSVCNLVLPDAVAALGLAFHTERHLA
jgi:hypothetical protein